MIEQGSEEWFRQRLGRVTASRIADVKSSGAGRKNYMAQLIAERLTGNIPESYTNAAMQWGTDTEPLARSHYEFMNDVVVKPCGFVDHPKIKMAGASPDGELPNNGGIEIKCPNTATHLDSLLSDSGKPPMKYQHQMNWQMACTGWDFIDWVSFDPRLSEKHQMLVIRFERDDTTILDLEEQVIEFIEELEFKLNKLENLK